MKNKKQPINNANRRDFIKMPALGATSFTVALASGAAKLSVNEKVSGGYKETEHVKILHKIVLNFNFIFN